MDIHQPLPSFPTRRSSDLPNLGSAFREYFQVRYPEPNPELDRPDLVRELLGRSQAARRARELRATAPGRRTGPGARSRDRKSTRLNSSHVSISYAVFCLKK